MRDSRGVTPVVALIMVLTSTACATVTVRVPVVRPAEIDLHGKNELVLAGISAPINMMPAANEINDRLKNAVVDCGRFKVVDRQHLERINAERSMGASERAKLTGSIMLFGRLEKSGYAEKLYANKDVCMRMQGEKEINYPCTKNERVGEAHVTVAFDVVDVQSGENLKAKRMVCAERRTIVANDAEPAAIAGRTLIEICNQRVVEDFVKAIAPWEDVVAASFLRDRELPSLEVGINYAKQGEWRDAIDRFKVAVDMASANADLTPSVVAKTHWDLGLAYEYSAQFDRAMAEVKLAYDLTEDEDFLQEIGNIKTLKSDQERLHARSIPTGT